VYSRRKSFTEETLDERCLKPSRFNDTEYRESIEAVPKKQTVLFPIVFIGRKFAVGKPNISIEMPSRALLGQLVTSNDLANG
jgi:hypothetical protein